MKFEVFSSYSDKELYEKLNALRIEIFNSLANRRFASKSELGKVKFAKKSVARILTLLSERSFLGS